MVDWLVFSRYALVFDARAREHGKATYWYAMLFRLAIHSLTSFSFFPLKVVGYLGILVTLISSCLAIFVIFDKLVTQMYAFSNIVLIVILNTWIMGIYPHGTRIYRTLYSQYSRGSHRTTTLYYPSENQLNLSCISCFSLGKISAIALMVEQK